MARKKTTTPTSPAPLFRAYGEEGPDMGLMDEAMSAVEPIHHTVALDRYRGIDGGGTVSVREGMTPEAYEYFRPNERIPTRPRDIMSACMHAYRRIGLLRNVVDMMSSFGSQGIQVIHPVKKREKFYKYWFHKVNGPERSERFLHNLYAMGNVVVKRGVSKLGARDLSDLQRGLAVYKPDTDYFREARPGRNELPIEYTFLNPALVTLVGGDLATFLGRQIYVLQIPATLMTSIRTPKTPTEEQLIKMLPEFVRKPVQDGQRFIDLDNDQIRVYHYMKEDWQQWADPLAYSILDDLNLYRKMKMADLAALDGAISRVRIWKLGSLEHKIQPGPKAIERLQEMLLANTGGGAIDLVWDATLNLEESSTNVHQFLGVSKYEPVLQSIYAGLGIPQSLTGGGKQGAGFTNNAISIKTVIERLQYGRDLLTDFWQNELRIVQEATGDPKPARITYDNMNLYDEAAEKMLWFNLYDRHLIDDETMQERFGLIPEVVAQRIKRDESARASGRKPPKATPYHDPQSQHELDKIALQQGTVSPTEMGVKKQPKQPGDMSLIDHQKKMRAKRDKMGGDEPRNPAVLDNAKKGVPGQGRPRNSKDSKPRKQRTPKPRTSAELQEWVTATDEKIIKKLRPIFLKACNKKNMRALSEEEREQFELMKTDALWATPPFGKIPSLPLSESAPHQFIKLIAAFTKSGDSQSAARIQAYTLLHGDNNG